MIPNRLLIILISILSISLLITGCNGNEVMKNEKMVNGNNKVIVFTTIYPVYNFTTNICGDRAQVVQLIPDGVEPHDWEPTPKDMVNLEQASLFIYNGAGLERWVEKMLRNFSDSGSTVVDSSKGVDLLPVTDGQTIDLHLKEPDNSHVHSFEMDPHIWLDPMNAKLMIDNIVEGLEKVDPNNTEYYRENARSYKQRLSDLHEKYAAILAEAEQRKFIVSHAAFGYLAHRYNLEQLAIRGISPEVDPGPARMAEIIETSREAEIKYIFSEKLVSQQVSKVIAMETGAEVLLLNPLGAITLEERKAGKDYLSIMEENLRNLSLALGVNENGH